MCLVGCVLSIWECLIAVLLIKTVNALVLPYYAPRMCASVRMSDCFCPSLFVPGVCVCVAAVLVHHCLSSSMC